jgi:alkylation response protein AidB-like acyl-CoA dehydrogenase
MNSAVSSSPQGSTLITQDDLESLRDSVAKVLARECDSRAVHDYIDEKADLDKVIWARAAEQGWLAAALPEAWGGLGLGPQGLCVIHSELGRRTAPGPFIATLSVAQWIAESGDHQLKDRLLPRLAGGQLKAAVPAVFSPDARLSLAGTKARGSIDVLGPEDAGLILAPYGTRAAVEGWAFIEAGPGVSLKRRGMWDLTRELCTLECDGATVVAALPDSDEALGKRLKAHVSLALAADSFGAATTIAHQTTEYTKTRVQFDKPIGSFQAIKHRAADMVINIETRRHVLDHAVECVALAAPDAEMWAALAKVLLTESFAFVSGDCIQLHGGVGHTWEFDPHIFAKRARLNEALASNNRTLLDFAKEELVRASREGRLTTALGV